MLPAVGFRTFWGSRNRNPALSRRVDLIGRFNHAGLCALLNCAVVAPSKRQTEHQKRGTLSLPGVSVEAIVYNHLSERQPVSIRGGLVYEEFYFWQMLYERDGNGGLVEFRDASKLGSCSRAAGWRLASNTAKVWASRRTANIEEATMRGVKQIGVEITSGLRRKPSNSLGGKPN